jgi:hypothetical protein
LIGYNATKKDCSLNLWHPFKYDINELLYVKTGISNDETSIIGMNDRSLVMNIQNGIKDIYTAKITRPKIMYAYFPAKKISYDISLLSEINFDIDCGKPNWIKTSPIALIFNATAKFPYTTGSSK